MNRQSGQYPVTVGRGVIAWTMFLTGFALIATGFIFLAVELLHAARDTHPLIVWPNLGVAVGCVIGGAQLVRTGSVQETIAIVRDSIPLLASRRVGGDRATDIPLHEAPTDEHPEVRTTTTTATETKVTKGA